MRCGSGEPHPQRKIWRPHWPLQTARTNWRRRLRHRMDGRPGSTAVPPHGCAGPHRPRPSGPLALIAGETTQLEPMQLDDLFKRRVSEQVVAEVMRCIARPPNKRDKPLAGDLQGE